MNTKIKTSPTVINIYSWAISEKKRGEEIYVYLSVCGMTGSEEEDFQIDRYNRGYWV